MTDTTSDIRREMAETRDRMARDVEAIKDHVTSPVRTAKQRLDVAQLVREHPWPALGAAVLLGSIVGSSGADAKAAGRSSRAGPKTASADVEIGEFGRGSEVICMLVFYGKSRVSRT